MSYINYLIANFKNKGLVIDANLWLLLLVGTNDSNEITEFKRTQTYSKQDFEVLIKFLKFFKVITTPNILTEVVNLTETLNRKTKNQLFENLANLTNNSNEYYIPSLTVMNDVYLKFGLSDSGINSLSEKGYLVLTDDLPLYGYISTNGNPVINFNHIRSEYLLI